jgi:hypothetical protein
LLTRFYPTQVCFTHALRMSFSYLCSFSSFCSCSSSPISK